MKQLLLIIAFIGLSSFTAPKNTQAEIFASTNFGAEDIVEYCISLGGNMYCCAAATYTEARSCAVAMADAATQD